MKNAKPETIDEYIRHSPAESQKIMEELKRVIETTAPNAEGVISWNVPIYKLNGILAGFSVAKHHVSFGIDSLEEEDRETLKEKGYKTGKNTIQIKFDQKVPSAEISQLIKKQLKINEK